MVMLWLGSMGVYVELTELAEFEEELTAELSAAAESVVKAEAAGSELLPVLLLLLMVPA